eukprot:3652684-Pleurochrysis_carterae.AAC.2
MDGLCDCGDWTNQLVETEHDAMTEEQAEALKQTNRFGNKEIPMWDEGDHKTKKLDVNAMPIFYRHIIITWTDRLKNDWTVVMPQMNVWREMLHEKRNMQCNMYSWDNLL